jgi:hypothetical protein
VMRVGDDLDVLGAGFGQRLQDPVDHGPAAEGMKDLGGLRAHSSAMAGGEDDRCEGMAQIASIMPATSRPTYPGRSITFL